MEEKCEEKSQSLFPAPSHPITQQEQEEQSKDLFFFFFSVVKKHHESYMIIVLEHIPMFRT